MSVRAMPAPVANKRNVIGGFGSAQKAKVRGSGHSGPDSTKPTQAQEGDRANTGGTAPGGTVAFMGAASQWSTSNAANRNNFPTGSPNIDPVSAAKMQHYGLADESPAEKGDVPVHPGLAPGLYRTARDANYNAPDGKTPVDYSVPVKNDPTAPDGRGNRGRSPEVLKQSRGEYRP